MKRSLAVMMVVLAFQGCVKEVSWPVKENTPGKIVVEAVLTDEAGPQKVVLSYPVAQLNQVPEPATGATVIVSDGDSAWTLTENPAGSGNYRTPPGFSAQMGKIHTLRISLNGKIYSAKASMAAGSYFPEVKCLKNEGNDLYHVDWVANAFSTASPAMWELILDWSKVEGYTRLDSMQTHARMLFYTLPTLDVSQVFAPVMESVNFPAGTIITERRYSITPEYAEFIREPLLETSWTGGLFNTAAADVTTNLSGGACGFFAVCAVNELSVTVAE